ncbi:MAG: alpha/beta hydrolase [Gemmatimonadales bacterium]
MSALVITVAACGACGSDTSTVVSPPPPPPGNQFPDISGSAAEIRNLGTFHSNILNNDRRIRVYLPPGYSSTTARYPVLYAQDGQNAFGTSGMGYDVTATSLIKSLAVRPIIIVAIDNMGTPQARAYEYSPFDQSGNLAGGGLLYARMLIEELKPRIDSLFRTLPEVENTGVAGHSLSGMVCWYMALWYPQAIGLMAAQSTPILAGDTTFVRQVRSLPGKLPVRIYYDRGTQDGEQFNRDVEQVMRQTLAAKGWVEGTDFRYYLVPGATHGNAEFAKRVDELLTFLFPRK